MKLLKYSYKQKNNWGCGPAVARIVLHHHDIVCSMRQAAKEMGTTRGGTENTGLIRFLRKNGLQPKAKEKAELSEVGKLLKKNIIVVAYWIPKNKEAHYSILKRIKSGRVFFHDPWYGANHSYSLSYFQKNWHDGGTEQRWMLAVGKNI